MCTLLSYYRLHGHRWRRYWRSNFVVRLIPEHNVEDSIDLREQSSHNFDAEDFEWRIEEIEEFT